ncbi:MAG: primosomal protein N', partial [Clostridia bacterium]|nr:primosomal protein N' [Clostridia bacterium]
MLTVGVALENTAYHFDKLYDYAVPADLAQKAKPGVRVLVPFGKSNAGRQGLILRINESAPNAKLKNISQIKDDEPLIDGDLLKLVFWLKDRTFCTYFEAFRCIVPTGIGLKLNYCFGADPNYEVNAENLPSDEKEIYFSLLKTCRFVEKNKLLSAFGFKSDALILDKMYKKGALLRNIDAQRAVADKTQTLYRLTVDIPELEKLDTSLTAKQKSVCELLGSTGGASLKEICYFTGVTGAVVKTLERKNLVEQVEYEVYRSPLEGKKTSLKPEIVLSEEQQQVFESVSAQMDSGEKNISLLYGITGSGKTQIYIKLIEKVINSGKSAIMMVPEIALTPQIIDRFCSYFGDKIAVFHSALSLGERTDEWKRVSRGEVNVVIGTRSAVFAPLKNLGLIIIDEEQEHTYKSEQSPRYNAKEVARFRCEENGAMLLLGSATPDVETFARAQKGIYTLNILKNRYAGATLPEVITVDMAYEGDNTLSSKLVSAIKETLDNKQQAILLINRRGYNTFASCKACKTVVTCPNCSISLTYHHANSRLMCHYCGYSQPLSDKCPECEKRELVYAGFGTQLVEDELAHLFPDARILRMEKDFAPSAFVDVEEPKGLGKFNVTAKYWYQRRLAFEEGIEVCK